MNEMYKINYHINIKYHIKVIYYLAILLVPLSPPVVSKCSEDL